jgi:hypothetical protein
LIELEWEPIAEEQKRKKEEEDAKAKKDALEIAFQEIERVKKQKTSTKVKAVQPQGMTWQQVRQFLDACATQLTYVSGSCIP